MKHLQDVNFTLQSGERVYFDENGDPSAMYELVNWQRNQAGDIIFVAVGSYDASLPNESQLAINGINITWVSESQMVSLFESREYLFNTYFCRLIKIMQKQNMK